MCWFYLMLAAVAEILFVFEMKLSNGFSKVGHAVCCLIVMSVGVFLLSLAIRKIPVATAYAIWTGLGVVGTMLLDCLVFNAPFSSARTGCILLILVGVVGLKLL